MVEFAPGLGIAAQCPDTLARMREASSDYAFPPDACISYKTLYSALTAFEVDLHQHIHLENNILFPRAMELEEMSGSI